MGQIKDPTFLLISIGHFLSKFSVMNQNRPRRGRRNGTTPRAQLQALKSQLHGHQNKLQAAAPPSFTQVPYNSITVSQRIKGGAGSYQFGVKDICTYLLTQFGIPNAQIVALVD